MSCGRRYFRAAASSAPKRCGRRQWWSGLSDVGHYRRPRWSCLSRCQERRGWRAVARQSRDLSAEGQYRQCVQSSRFALSTANLFSATQPGGSLFGLQESNPVNPAVAYVGSSATWGTAADNLMGQKIGGVNVFGGGLALYNGGLVGGLGVSGDTSCADHNIAWRVRAALGLNHVPSGVAPAGNDGIIYDVTGSHGNFESKSGFGHPSCGGTEQDVAKNIGAGG